jgi:hypothetical protein
VIAAYACGAGQEEIQPLKNKKRAEAIMLVVQNLIIA